MINTILAQDLNEFEGRYKATENLINTMILDNDQHYSTDKETPDLVYLLQSEVNNQVKNETSNKIKTWMKLRKFNLFY